MYDGVHTGDVHVYGLDSAGFVDASMAMTMNAPDALVHEILTAYDARGLPQTQTDAEFTYGYDAEGRRISQTDRVYGEAFVYDLNGTVRATYDTSGQMTAQYLAHIDHKVR